MVYRKDRFGFPFVWASVANRITRRLTVTPQAAHVSSALHKTVASLRHMNDQRYKFKGAEVLAIEQQKVIRHSLKLFFAFSVAFLASVTIKGVEAAGIVFGLVLGFIWALCLPMVWKKDLQLLSTLLTVGVGVTVTLQANDSWTGLQVVTLGLGSACFVWHVFRQKVLSFLRNEL